MTSLTITLPLPPKEVRPNGQHGHWAVVARAKKGCRADAMLTTACAMRAAGMLPPSWKKAKVAIKAHFKTRRHLDPDNMVASLKAYLDGIADAGVVENDRGLWPERPEFFTDKANPRVELTITEEA